MSRAGTEDAVDDDIRRTIWNGTVPVMFTLAPAEVTGTATPRPLFVRSLSSIWCWYEIDKLTNDLSLGKHSSVYIFCSQTV